jgi:hypothetical protein
MSKLSMNIPNYGNQILHANAQHPKSFRAGTGIFCIEVRTAALNDIQKALVLE